MSKTLITTNDVPQYIRDIVKNLRPSVSEPEETALPGYTFRLYGSHKVGYESQLSTNCEKLLDWCRRYYADAYVVQRHFWFDDVAKPGGAYTGDKYHQRKAYRERFRNYIAVVITDPVAYRFEKDGYYRERKQSLDQSISQASTRVGHTSSQPNRDSERDR